MRHTLSCILAVAALAAFGCRSAERPFIAARPKATTADAPTDLEPVSYEEQLVVPGDSAANPPAADPVQPEEIDPGDLLLQPLEPPSSSAAPTLDEVVASVRFHFPLVQQAALGRVIASGEALEAAGAFDRKLDLFSESQPLGFYENYRNSAYVKRDTMWGGQTFAGYRIGRGFFEPWYLERETNDGGEFKAGVVAPVIRDREIDANRAQLWQAQLEQGRIEPVIRAQVIQSVLEGAIAYWDWVAAAANLKVAQGVLELAENREGFLERQVELGEKAEIDLVDNRRIIVSRQAKLTDARRKLEQATYKLSLYLRSPAGVPIVLDEALAKGEFPEATDVALLTDPEDVARAVANRPELVEIQVVRQQLTVALRQAVNEMQPDVDAGLLVSQDVGAPTSASATSRNWSSRRC